MNKRDNNDNMPHSHSQHSNTPTLQSRIPRVIAWEVTRRCNLKCRHCRGSARDENYKNELSTDECMLVINNIADFTNSTPPILILTGGEPMTRPDIYALANLASSRGMRTVMAPCGHLITEQTAGMMKDSGIKAISISIDGATPEKHDDFRGVKGAFEKTIEGLKHAINAGIPFQVNTTVTRNNVDDLPEILAKAIELGAQTFDVFFLVPTGRGSELKEMEISPETAEKTLKWIHEVSLDAPIRIKTTCAPHYARIQRQSPQVSSLSDSRTPNTEHRTNPASGCMGGRGFVFISHTGMLQPCGFFDKPCGDLRKENFDFKKLYLESMIFNDLRKPDDYGGKCGICEFRYACGGCRARALTHAGDYMDEEPTCSYIPGGKRV